MPESDETHNPHDALFQKVFAKTVVAGEFFRAMLPPAIVREIDWGSLTREPKTFVDEEFRRSASDLLFSARMGEEQALLYCLFEHQSTPDGLMPLRLVEYMTRIWRQLIAEKGLKFGELPPIIPVVLSQGPQPWKESTRFMDMMRVPDGVSSELREYLVDFRHILLDLSDWDPEEFRGEMFIRSVLAIMKAVRDGRVDAVRNVLFPMSTEMILRSTTTGILESMLYYVVREGPEPLLGEMRRSLRATRGPELEEKMLTKFAQKYLEKGEKRGEKRGKKQGERIGEIKGLQEAVFEGLEIRFGEPSADLREKVQSVKEPQALKELVRAAWQSDSIEEFEESL